MAIWTSRYSNKELSEHKGKVLLCWNQHRNTEVPTGVYAGAAVLLAGSKRLYAEDGERGVPGSVLQEAGGHRGLIELSEWLEDGSHGRS